jgi:O-antigen/teichoic acid export membrane protein
MADPDAAPSPAKIDGKAMRNTVLWGAGLAFGTKIGSILLSLVLARLITPQMFGQYGVVSGLILLLMSFSMQYFAAHLFHQKAPKPEEYHLHLTFGIMLHGLLFVLCNLIALAMHFIPQYRPIAGYVHIGSLALLINVPRFYYSVYLRVELQWRKMRTLQIGSFVLYATASVVLAYLGQGVYALLSQNLLVPIPFVIAFFLDSKNLRALRFSWREYREAFFFGLLRTASGGVSSAQTALEGFALSLLAGFGTLGLLNRARGLALLATSWLSDQVSTILYPSLARLEPRSPEARRTAGLLLKVGLWTTAPVAVSLAMADRAAIYTLYGYQWGKVVPLVRPMLLAAVASSLFGVVRMVVLTNDGPYRTLILDCVMAAANLGCLIALWLSGMQAYAVALGGIGAITVAVMLAAITRDELVNWRDLAGAVLPGALLTILGLPVGSSGWYLALEAANPIVTMITTGAVCSVVALALIRFVDPAGLNTLCGLLPGGGLARRWLLLDRAA